jgi:hypothetical protein
MKTTVAGKVAVICFAFSLLVGCGEMDSLYSPSETYLVRTLVNNYSLDECSIIRSDDTIRPYFVASVVNDPDLTGLLVYLLDSKNEVVGERVLYVIKSYADETALTETIEENTENEAEEATETPETESENETVGQSIEELLDQWTIRPRWGFTSTQVTEKNDDKIIIVPSFDHDLPYFPMPKDLKPGSYNLVFEALGGRGILSHTEKDIFYLGNIEFNLKDISMYLPGVSGSQLILPGTTVMLEAGLDFDSALDPYLIWYQGRTILSEGKMSDGAGSILWEAPGQAGFYSLRVEASPIRLKRGLVGFVREISLPVSPKAAHNGYFFEDNPNFTAQNALATGITYPEQTRIAAELAQAENPDDTVQPPPSPPELLRWYQFNGNLFNSTSRVSEWPLIPDHKNAPQWAAAGQSYGLSAGVDDPYSLSPVPFLRKGEDQGGGIFLFHVRPLTEGIILSAFFPLQSSMIDGVLMLVTKEKNNIILSLSVGGDAFEIPIYISPAESLNFIPVVVEFYIRPYRMEAILSLGEAQYQGHEAKSINIPRPLTGECKIVLGTQYQDNVSWRSTNENLGETRRRFTFSPANNALVNYAAENPIETILDMAAETDYNQDLALLSTLDTASSETAETNIPQPVNPEYEKILTNTIWNEFAILFSELPLIPEEVSEAVSEETDETTDTADEHPATEMVAVTENRVPPRQDANTQFTDVVSLDSGNVQPLEIKSADLKPETLETEMTTNVSLAENILTESDGTDTEEYENNGFPETEVYNSVVDDEIPPIYEGS